MKHYLWLIFFLTVIFVNCENRLDGYHMYQTFNEYTMKGVGEPNETPFVYVKDIGDEIFVIKSNNLDSIIIYKKIDNNTWFSARSFDMDKMNPKYDFCQTEIGYPRVYYRLFLGDSIIEYMQQFWGVDIKTSTNLLFVKTPKTCIEIGVDSLYTNDLLKLKNQMLQISHNYSNLKNLQLVDDKIWYYDMNGWYISFDCY